MLCPLTLHYMIAVALGVAFYTDDLPWLPLVSLMVYMAAFSIGYGPVPWVLMSE